MSTFTTLVQQESTTDGLIHQELTDLVENLDVYIIDGLRAIAQKAGESEIGKRIRLMVKVQEGFKNQIEGERIQFATLSKEETPTGV